MAHALRPAERAWASRWARSLRPCLQTGGARVVGPAGHRAARAEDAEPRFQMGMRDGAGGAPSCFTTCFCIVAPDAVAGARLP